MKATYKLTSAILLGALGVGVAVASETKADDSQTGAGKVEFTQSIDESDGITLPPDTLEPEISLTEDDVIPGTDPFQLKVITSLDFKTHNIVATDTTEKTYPVNVYTAAKADGTGDFDMPHFVRFRDYRAEDGQENFYKVTAKMTKDFTNGSSVLNGTLNYKNVSLTSKTNEATMPEKDHADVTVKDNFSLNATNADAEEVLVQKQAGKGFGLFELMFGTYDHVNAATDGTYDDIELVVPGSTLIKTGTYNAEITWTLEDAR